MSAETNKTTTPPKRSLSPMWPARQIVSESKWRNILSYVQLAARNNDDPLRRLRRRNSFVKTTVLGRCGYCEEFFTYRKFDECHKCPLFKGGYCNLDDLSGQSIFWDIADGLNAKNPNWSKITGLVSKMYERIQQDGLKRAKPTTGRLVDKTA